jgi:NAD(P)-dependent dehydrogenase (short-subunit alcohol dehydrogenase family)
VEWVRTDLAVPGSGAALVARAQELIGPVSVLVNNAGVQVERTVAASTDVDWERVVGVNCRAVFETCRAALPMLVEHGGSIVTIGSISGRVADPTMALYNASKAFVVALMRSIAVDHGPAVRANTVSPGWVRTDMTGDAFALAADPTAAERDAVARHPAGRLGSAADVAATVAWLISPEAAFVTGQDIVVDGGLTAASPLRPGLF